MGGPIYQIRQSLQSGSEQSDWFGSRGPEPTANYFDFIFAEHLPEVSSFCVVTLVHHLRSILDYK
jgi:hypothetical protein